MIRVKEIGYQFINLGGIDINRPEGSGDYLFLFFRCPTEVMIGGAYERVPENTFLLYKKGEPQIYRRTDGHFINDWIHFEIDPYDDFFEKLEIPSSTLITLGDNDVIAEMIADLFIEYFNVGKQHEYIMDKKVTVLFYKFSDLYKLTRNGGIAVNKYLRELTDIRKKVYNHEYVPKGAQDAARHLNISTSYFQHIYKSFFGVSFNQDIIKGRVEYAARLLRETNSSVAEIARLCGYENQEHFSRQFKKIKGCPPKKFRVLFGSEQRPKI